jgi:4-alpha-glucanotransferase
VAEDLGVITPEVDAMRMEMQAPGMKIIQFGFGNREGHSHLPYNFGEKTVAYTGTHDNDTTLGWYQSASEYERSGVHAYTGIKENESPVWPLIRAVATSPAQIAMVPAQDLLVLGAEARMNTPAVAAGNWSWRAPEHCWTPELVTRLGALVDVTDRNNDPLGLVDVHQESSQALDSRVG